MPYIAAIVMLLVFIFPASPAEIPKGAHLLLRMDNSISTKTAQEGDYVYLRTESPVVAEGHIVVPNGSYVQGVVSRAKQSGRVKGRAELSIHLETLTLASGKVYRIAPRLASVESDESGQKVDNRENDIKQGGTKGKDAETIAITAGSGAAIGGLADRSWKGAGIGAGVGTGVGLARVGKAVAWERGGTAPRFDSGRCVRPAYNSGVRAARTRSAAGGQFWRIAVGPWYKSADCVSLRQEESSRMPVSKSFTRRIQLHSDEIRDID